MSINPLSVSAGISKITYIYFDLDDTLIDHRHAQARALVDLWSHYPQLRKADPEKMVGIFSEVNNKLWEAYRNKKINRLALRQNRFELTFRKFRIEIPDLREVNEIYSELYQRHWEWIDDARDALVTLSKHFGVGVMTNGFTDVQQKKFEYFSLHRFSKNLVISEEAGYLKPDQRIFEYSAEKAGKPADQLLYVGDSYDTDILGGKKSGWKTAWYCPGKSVDRENAADITFNHFSQLVEILTPKY